MLSSNKSPEEQAIESIAPKKFHQIFTLPANDSHGPLKVTYAVCGRDREDTPTVMFCGGMFGSRWQAPFQNWLAEKEGVRIIFIDRPGFGGSTIVPIPQRIPVFLEAVPALLKHLNIKHISIGSHSSGTIFALNLLSTQPQLLYSNNPSITLCSPWVHQSHSGVSFLAAAAMLPNNFLNHWSSLTGFIINSASPTFAASSGALSSITSKFGGKANSKKKRDDNEKMCMEGYGVGSDVKKELEKLVMKCAFAEECSGGNDEARLCLKSVDGSGWGVVEDYPSFIAALKERWEEKVDNGEQKLIVRVLLAEEDMMIGENGRRYIEDCWTEEKCGRGIDVQCLVIEGTDHDEIFNPSNGAVGEVYRALKESRPAFRVAE